MSTGAFACCFIRLHHAHSRPCHASLHVSIRAAPHCATDGRTNVLRVLCSHNYGGNNLAAVHNGEWYTAGHAEAGRTWAGSDNTRGRHQGGSWLGFTFREAGSVHSVRMAQGRDNFAFSLQGVSSVWLEAWSDERGAWERAGELLFTAPLATSYLAPALWRAAQEGQFSPCSSSVACRPAAVPTLKPCPCRALGAPDPSAASRNHRELSATPARSLR